LAKADFRGRSGWWWDRFFDFFFPILFILFILSEPVSLLSAPGRENPRENE
jgi:hypothetical protein